MNARTGWTLIALFAGAAALAIGVTLFRPQPPARPRTPSSRPTTTTPRAPALTAAQRAAAEHMRSAAKKALEGLTNLEAIRARTPEFFAQKLLWQRHGLDTDLLLNPQGPQRTAALQEFLQATAKCYDETVARAQIDATKASIALAAFTKAQAEYLVLTDGNLSPATTPEQKQLAQQMLDLAQQQFQGILDLENIRPRTPEFLQLRLDTCRCERLAQCLLHATGPERRSALQRYVDQIKRVAADTHAREGIDATKASLAAADYALAEAQYLLLTDGILAPATTPEQKQLAQQMLDLAQQQFQGILDLENIRPRTPEFLQLRLDACRRLLDTEYLLTPTGPQRRQALETYRTQAKNTYDEILKRMNLDATPASIAMADYAVAEADWLLASAPD
jgi:hypothetical protein